MLLKAALIILQVKSDIMAKLEIKDLHVSVEGNTILKGVSLTINQGEIHTLMGPNGSGKSTLALSLMGHPNYEITKGKILIDGKDVTSLSPDKRANKGLFLSFQYPSSIPGVSVSNFLRTAYNSLHGNKERMNVMNFQKLLSEKMDLLKIDKSFAKRYLNEGFSGGEKKRAEILQMAVLKPKLAILDETDSGTDVDALKIISNGINTISKAQKTGILLITHYNRILQYIHPDHVHIIKNGKIVKSGGKMLAEQIEKEGYENL